MGAVWRAEHLVLKSHVAVKLIEPTLLAQPEALARFLREAQAAASLRSPHVVQILDYGIDGELPYIVMELLEGESLSSRLARVRCLSPRSTAEVISQVSRAIVRAHERGIVHRDLKPDNIFLTANDDIEVAKVLDFGIAKHTLPGSHGMTQTGAVLGTPYYMSPEQAEGARDVDFRSDLWALSVITFECLLGRRPFDEEAIGSLILAICTRPIPVPSQLGQVPAGFDEWFSKGVSRQRENRFESARELASSLRRVCGLEDSGHGMREDARSSAELPLGGAQSHINAPAPANVVARTSAAITFPHTPETSLSPPMNKPSWGLIGTIAALVLGVATTAFWLYRGSDGGGASAAASADSALTIAPAATTATPLTPTAATPTAATTATPAPSIPSAVEAPSTVASATTAPAAAMPRGVPAKPQPRDLASRKPPQDKTQGTTILRPTQKVDLGI